MISGPDLLVVVNWTITGKHPNLAFSKNFGLWSLKFPTLKFRLAWATTVGTGLGLTVTDVALKSFYY